MFGPTPFSMVNGSLTAGAAQRSITCHHQTATTLEKGPGISRRPVDGNRVPGVSTVFTVWTLGPLKISQYRSRGEFRTERRQHDMFIRFATLAAACMLVPVGTAPLAL